MTEEKSILFVCTGNIFRSLSAQKIFEQYLKEQGISGWKVGSAGIVANPQTMHSKVGEVLTTLGISDLSHTQRKVTKEILDSYDAIVCMAQDHLDFLQKEFGHKGAMLFNSLANGEETSILDVNSAEDLSDPTIMDAKIEKTIKDIYEKIPNLFKNVSERFYLFSDFVNGRKTHRNGYPFIPLYETPHAIAFMSLDIPQKTDGHILVIPKKRYADFAKIPAEIANDIFATLSIIGKTLVKNHDGYNILLNNGIDAGQYIFHTHFHIVPRKKGDGIQLEGWQRHDVTVDEFISLNQNLKNQIAQVI